MTDDIKMFECREATEQGKREREEARDTKEAGDDKITVPYQLRKAKREEQLLWDWRALVLMHLRKLVERNGEMGQHNNVERFMNKLEDFMREYVDDR